MKPIYLERLLKVAHKYSIQDVWKREGVCEESRVGCTPLVQQWQEILVIESCSSDDFTHTLTQREPIYLFWIILKVCKWRVKGFKSNISSVELYRQTRHSVVRDLPAADKVELVIIRYQVIGRCNSHNRNNPYGIVL